MAPLLSTAKAQKLASVAASAVASSRERRAPVTDEQRMGALGAWADWDGEICPPRWPWPWPPRPRGPEDIDDPMVFEAIDVARAFVLKAGSEMLGQELGAALDELTGERRR